MHKLMKFLTHQFVDGNKEKAKLYQDYWSTLEELNDTFISQQMSVKGFSWILSQLHLMATFQNQKEILNILTNFSKLDHLLTTCPCDSPPLQTLKESSNRQVLK
ncbi:hypothetical protein TNCV_1473091 [Trichonephila clavipes]|nr:hypothetical protein TNCV_1473091 [Trichonephila clavipes]